MRKTYAAIFLISSMILLGCAVRGPGPTKPGYSDAIKTIPFAESTKYVAPSSWHPNILLGSISSFSSSFVEGTLFVTQEGLIFAMYDTPTKSFVSALEVSFSSVDWITVKQHGVARILRLQSNNVLQSFLVWDGVDSEGNAANKDTILNYILSMY